MHVLAAVVFAACLTPAAAFAQAGAWRVSGGDLRVQCPLTVGGSFEARTRIVTGMLQPGQGASDAMAGELAVDLRSLDTGIALRNQHMRDTYLEVGRGDEFQRAVLMLVSVNGIDIAAPGGRGTFTGRLRLHGVEQQVGGQVDARRTDRGVRVRASFPLSLRAFGIADPRYLGVGVRDQVTVQATIDFLPAEPQP